MLNVVSGGGRKATSMERVSTRTHAQPADHDGEKHLTNEPVRQALSTEQEAMLFIMVYHVRGLMGRRNDVK